MVKKPPILDERELRNILEDLQTRTLIDLPEWTPPPVGDAGTMLQRLFARLLEITLQRLNQAPEKNLLAFLNTLGLSLLSPSPAKAPLTFAVTEGNPPTLVPGGTQAGAQPEGEAEALTFETEDDLTVIPAQLTVGFTMDPTWDRYEDQTQLLDGQNPPGFTPFVGVKSLPHILYFGNNALLNVSGSAGTTVEIKLETRSLSDEVRKFLSSLLWQYRTGGELKILTPPSSGPIKIAIPDPIDQEIIQGVGLPDGLKSRWLRATLPIPFPDAQTAHDLRLSDLILKIEANGLLPDFAFNNDAPLDVTKEFLPFGEAPKVSDAFYIANQEAFSKPDVEVTLHLEVQPSPSPALVWEIFDGNDWVQLSDNFIIDGTESFTHRGIISLFIPENLNTRSKMLPFRARIFNGKYQGSPRVDIFRFQETTLADSVSAADVTITLTTPDFSELDDVLFVENELVQVVQEIDPGPPQKLRITPFFLHKHKKNSPVERRFSSLEPIARIVEQTGDNLLIISPVSTTQAFYPGQVLLILDNDSSIREFIKVIDVHDLSVGKLELTLAEPLRFNHTPDTNLHLISSTFFGFVDGKIIDFTEPFYPFGKQPGIGDMFVFLWLPPSLGIGATFLIWKTGDTGSVRKFVTEMSAKVGKPSDSGVGEVYDKSAVSLSNRIDIFVDLTMTAPELDLTWESSKATGWQPIDSTNFSDGTNNFLQSGDINFKAQAIEPAEVNGQKNHWIRIRIASGNYGLPVEFIPVDPEDPSKGFMVKPGTGNLNPPVLKKLTINYIAERSPTVLTQNGFLYHDRTKANQRLTNGFAPFVSVKALVPQIYTDPEPSFYLGFNAVFPEQPVSLYIAVTPRAFSGRVVKETHSAPAPSSILPPLQWEYFNGTIWKELPVFDGTNHFTESGTVQFLTPTDMIQLAKFDLTAHFWIRACSSENDPFDTQQIQGVFLNTIPALQSEAVTNEILGSGSEQADQTFAFSRSPVLPGQQVMVWEPEPPSDAELVAITAEEGSDAVLEHFNTDSGEMEIWVHWHEVSNFLLSDSHNRHYTLDHSNGLLLFGNGKRGLIPPQGVNNIVVDYRTGGGIAGNVPRAAIAQVKSPLPGVAEVTNAVAADGGAAAEIIPMVQMRGPQVLKHRHRAIAGGDAEWLARQAAGTLVARTKCLPNINRSMQFEPGWVTLFIVPQSHDPKPSPGSELIRQVENYLAERTFMGLSQQIPSRINVIGPGYIQVIVRAEVVPRDIDETLSVKQRIIEALKIFLNALTGGPQSSGWVFGRDVYVSEICRIIEDLSGVSYVKNVRAIPNIAQYRFSFSSAPAAIMAFPAGSTVMKSDRSKAALLAEPVPSGTAIGRIAVKGFKEGDRITKVQDLTVVDIDSVSGTTIIVQSFDSDEAGFPRGSIITTFDGTLRTHLASGILTNKTGLTEIEVDDENIANQLTSGQVLTVFYPFPMEITSVSREAIVLTVQSVSGDTLTVAPFNSDIVDIPDSSHIATLDGARHTGLAQTIDKNKTGITEIAVQDTRFAASLKPGDSLTLQTPIQTLNIEPYETEVAFSRGSIFATLDNRVRLPLVADTPPADEIIITVLNLNDFLNGDPLIISRQDGRFELPNLLLQEAAPVNDIVFIDDNFLVYSGPHNIIMAGE